MLPPGVNSDDRSRLGIETTTKRERPGRLTSIDVQSKAKTGPAHTELARHPDRDPLTAANCFSGRWFDKECGRYCVRSARGLSSHFGRRLSVSYPSCISDAKTSGMYPGGAAAHAPEVPGRLVRTSLGPADGSPETVRRFRTACQQRCHDEKIFRVVLAIGLGDRWQFVQIFPFLGFECVHWDLHAHGHTARLRRLLADTLGKVAVFDRLARIPYQLARTQRQTRIAQPARALHRRRARMLLLLGITMVGLVSIAMYPPLTASWLRCMYACSLALVGALVSPTRALGSGDGSCLCVLSFPSARGGPDRTGLIWRCIRRCPGTVRALSLRGSQARG